MNFSLNIIPEYMYVLLIILIYHKRVKVICLSKNNTISLVWCNLDVTSIAATGPVAHTYTTYSQSIHSNNATWNAVTHKMFITIIADNVVVSLTLHYKIIG